MTNTVTKSLHEKSIKVCGEEVLIRPLTGHARDEITEVYKKLFPKGSGYQNPPYPHEVKLVYIKYGVMQSSTGMPDNIADLKAFPVDYIDKICEAIDKFYDNFPVEGK